MFSINLTQHLFGRCKNTQIMHGYITFTLSYPISSQFPTSLCVTSETSVSFIYLAQAFNFSVIHQCITSLQLQRHSSVYCKPSTSASFISVLQAFNFSVIHQCITSLQLQHYSSVYHNLNNQLVRKMWLLSSLIVYLT